MPQMSEQERRLYSRENLATLSYDEVTTLRRGLQARKRLADLGLANSLSESELQEEFDRMLKLEPERQVVRSYSASDEGELQRQFDVYMKVVRDPNAGQPISRAFSADNLDGDTPAERELADAFDAYMGV